MREAPRWSLDRLVAWGRERRRRIVEHAAATVPHYREALAKAGIDPASADRPEVWAAIPTVSKEEIRDHPERFVSSTAASHERFWASTSGSSGMPMKILLDPNVNAAAFALFWRAWGSGGYWKLGQRQAAMKGTAHASGWRYHRAIRTLEISAPYVGPETVSSLRDVIERYRPRFMRGYPSAMYVFCRLLREQGLTLHIPMIISGSETLHDFQREEIEGCLGARLFNHYTHWERAVSVLECERGMLHAQEDYGHHEILDEEDRPVPEGVPGEITGTSLHNLAMPFVRYRTGDVAMWSNRKCDCGQAFPVVEQILGRQSDFLVRRDGSLIAATSASSDVKFFKHVVYVQIVQDEPGAVEVRVVPTAEFSEPEDSGAILDNLRKRLGGEMKIAIRKCRVEDLERSPVGKVRACFTRVPRDRRVGVRT
jgi:phenylacetate-CoA ligase